MHILLVLIPIALLSSVSARSLLSADSTKLPSLASMQGTWQGNRTTGAYIEWDGDTFSGGCIRNNLKLISTAFGNNSNMDMDYKAGTLTYEARMQLLETLGRCAASALPQVPPAHSHPTTPAVPTQMARP